jgi:hypothetical protein
MEMELPGFRELNRENPEPDLMFPLSQKGITHARKAILAHRPRPPAAAAAAPTGKKEEEKDEL